MFLSVCVEQVRLTMSRASLHDCVQPVGRTEVSPSRRTLGTLHPIV
ncbi:hypothetical protein HMPREF9056_01423 [Actinomyces sp. oral taxon 170 str. F0386]|nr:hypothetical protein HMPREF9056_01423 [Actinomyces sp. oral taxon 170 str. F0386]